MLSPQYGQEAANASASLAKKMPEPYWSMFAKCSPLIPTNPEIDMDSLPITHIKWNDSSVAHNIHEEIFSSEGKKKEDGNDGADDNGADDNGADKHVFAHLSDPVQAPFAIIESYFQSQHLERLVRHQIESYNHFINYQIQRTIAMFNDVAIRSEKYFIPEEKIHGLEVILSFANFRMNPPQIHEATGATKIMMPNEARLRNFTYASTMHIDVHVKYIIRDGVNPAKEAPRIIEKTLSKVNIGKMPIMLKSSACILTQNRNISSKYTGECPMDCGGYFIIKGGERTILGQERAAENRIYCFDGKNTTKWTWYAEIRSVPDFKCISPKTVEMMISSKNNGDGFPIYVMVPRFKQPIELFVFFRAMGIESDEDICNYILLDCHAKDQATLLDTLRATIVESRRGNKYRNQEECCQYLVSMVAYFTMNVDKETALKRKRDFAHEVVHNDFFPHCRTLQQKLLLLGTMCKKLLYVSLGMIAPDDRDSYVNKRIELAGTLLNNLFRNYFNKLVKESQRKIMAEINTGSWITNNYDYGNILNSDNISKIIKSVTIENGINRALGTGDFSIKYNSNKVGVAQVLNRLTYAASLSHLRRINTPLEKSGELIEPRKLHNTTWGYFCPAETPEGQSIGIVKNISYMAHITIPTNSSSLYDCVRSYILPVDHVGKKEADDVMDADVMDESSSPFDEKRQVSLTQIRHLHELYGRVKVYINGAWVGVVAAHKNPQEVFMELKEKKWSGIINVYTSIIFDYKSLEIRLCTDGGRFTRPVLRVNPETNRVFLDDGIVNRVKSGDLSWNDLLLSNGRLPEAVIEYIDPEEQNMSMIAMRNREKYLHDVNARIRYTHAEIHPSTIFGVLASCIPFPEYNQAPRNTYQCFLPDEVVWMADDSYKALRDVTVGDQVWAFTKTNKLFVANVTGQFVQPRDKRVYRIKTRNGRCLVATEDHLFWSIWPFSGQECNWYSLQEILDHELPVLFRIKNSPDLHMDYIYEWDDVSEEVDNVSCIEIDAPESHSFFVSRYHFMVSNCAMGKQAIGVYATNYDQRMDKTSYVLCTPSRPLVETRLMDFIHLNQIPSGSTIHVAIMIHTGYNQEDSLLLNEASINRGLFSASIYHTERDEDNNTVRDEIIRCKPDWTKTRGKKLLCNYDKLTSGGFLPENTLIENRDVIISKVLPIKENRNDPTQPIKFEDQSKTYRTHEESYIDKNYTSRGENGYNFAKVRIRTLRKPVYGDKFSSRMGQKGTCGNIIPECDMPFTKEGMRPDIILNPHAIPSRMTIAQLKETLLGKVLLELGMFGDGTSFGNLSVASIAQELQRMGYESYGNEIMYDGLSGRQMEVATFFGPCFYQRLKHMVNDKQHSRAFGPMVNLTRQPAEGRARDGGFRIGEMERDCMIAHGMSYFCKDRLFDVSDKYAVHVCRRCGMMAAYNDGTSTRQRFTVFKCNTCDNRTDFDRVAVPYAYKLFAQELQAINIVPRLITAK
jgi:DNA-directed RNA polymerase beta subunit